MGPEAGSPGIQGVGAVLHTKEHFPYTRQELKQSGAEMLPPVLSVSIAVCTCHILDRFIITLSQVFHLNGPLPSPM